MVSDDNGNQSPDHQGLLTLELIQNMVEIQLAPVKERLERLEDKLERDLKEQRDSFSQEWHRLENRLATRYSNQLKALAIIVTIILGLITIAVNVLLRLLLTDP